MKRFQRESFVFIVMSLAFALRIGVCQRPLRYDEALTYWQATNMKVVPAGVGYSLLHVNLIKPLIGHWDEPWMLRLPFVVLGVASILFFMLATRELLGKTAPLIVALLLAISPFHVYYSSEIRMYAPALFGSAVNFFFFLRILREGRWTNWLGYIMGTVIGLYALWFVSLIVAVQTAYLLIDPVRRKTMRRWFLTQFVIAAAVLPAIWHALEVQRAIPSGLDNIESRPIFALAGTLYRFVMGMVFIPETWWYVLTFLGAGVFGLLCIRGILNSKPERSLVLGGAFVPLSIVLILSVWMHIYNEGTVRYLAFSQPFLVLLFVYGWVTLRSPELKAAVLIGTILIFTAALYPICFTWDRVGLGNFPEAAHRLRRLAEPEDCIAVPRNPGVQIAYYLRHRNQLVEQMIFGSYSEPPIAFPPVKRVWLVRLYNRQIPSYLKSWRDKELPVETGDPPGYDQVAMEVVPGRKPIVLCLYHRSNDQRR